MTASFMWFISALQCLVPSGREHGNLASVPWADLYVCAPTVQQAAYIEHEAQMHAHTHHKNTRTPMNQNSAGTCDAISFSIASLQPIRDVGWWHLYWQTLICPAAFSSPAVTAGIKSKLKIQWDNISYHADSTWQMQSTVTTYWLWLVPIKYKIFPN